MFKLSKPSQSEIDRFLLRARGQGFSYTEVGSTHGSIPVGYTVDHNRVSLGSGSRIFDDAAAALRTWQMFDLGWVRLFQPNTPIKVGATVVVLIRHFGFWSLNACRVVYLIEEEQRFGFAYGTLQEHAEQGEERFSVEQEPGSDSVFYDILAFSKPRQWQATVARPISRMLQRQFARDSMAAMKRAVQGLSSRGNR